jgi:uncharacterized protein (PEP-CTERM system associated)
VKVLEVTAITPTGGSHVTIHKLMSAFTSLRYPLWLQIFVLPLFLYTMPVHAGQWTITPRVSVGEIYSDNINLDDDDKEGDLITELTPGINIVGEGGRITGELDYQLQSLFFLSNSDASGVSQQMDANATAEVTKNFFFVDATSRFGQSIVDAQGTISRNNVNDAGNQTDFYAYGISPYILPHFGGYADGTFRYSLDHVRYDDDVSNSLENRFDASLVSGRKFGPLAWSADYVFDDINRSKAENVRYENAAADARYFINRKFSLVAQAGYANNDFDSSEEIENGSYWAVGGLWQPSRYYSLEALSGKNLDTVTVSLNPGRRTSLQVTYRDRKVGLNDGEAWLGTFRHRTRQTNWSADYTEDTTTQQQQQLGEGGFTFQGVDPTTGETNPNPQPGDLVVIVPTGPISSLTNEVIERKRGSATLGIRTGKTGLRFTVFKQQRRYLTSLREEDTHGFSASVNRRVAPRTNAVVTGSWQRIEDSDGGRGDTDFWFIEGDIRRQIRPRLEGMVGYSFTRQDSEENRDSYSENRIQARITAYF